MAYPTDDANVVAMKTDRAASQTSQTDPGTNPGTKNDRTQADIANLTQHGIESGKTRGDGRPTDAHPSLSKSQTWALLLRGAFYCLSLIPVAAFLTTYFADRSLAARPAEQLPAAAVGRPSALPGPGAGATTLAIEHRFADSLPLMRLGRNRCLPQSAVSDARTAVGKNHERQCFSPESRLPGDG